MAQLGNLIVNGAARILGDLKVKGEVAASSFIGNLKGQADKATKDSKNQDISATYIKGLSANGRTVTYTKGDGTTGTITTQDTNTTYSTGTASTAGLTKLYTGAGSATDGTMTQLSIKTELDKKIVSSSLASGTDVFGKIPYIGNDGVCEMGKYIDLHFSNKESHDYTTRLLPEDTDGSLIIQPRVSTTCLTLRSPSGASYVKFMSGWNNLGWIGIESVNGPAVHYNSSGARHRIYDSASITYGTSAPPSTAAAGDIYIQIS